MKFGMLAAVTTAAILAAPALAVSGTDTAEAKKEAAKIIKKPKKITDRRHPDYVRCRSQSIIGSLAKKKRVCMSNKEWAAHNKEGSRRSKQFVEDLQVGNNGSN